MWNPFKTKTAGPTFEEMASCPGVLETHSLEYQHQELVNALAEDNKREDNPWEVPEGFHKAYGAESGSQMGLGFYCPKCKLHILANAPMAVKHCGTMTPQPTGTLAMLRLKKFHLSKVFFAGVHAGQVRFY